MKWPLVLRSTYDEHVGILEENIRNMEAEIDAYKDAMASRDTTIANLSSLLTKEKCNDYTPKESEKQKKDPISVAGRSGWRRRAEMASDATIPPPADSMRALEQRVKEQGGTTNAVSSR
jgi:hypothetical protein